jgi:biopolymer transport protein ExbB/TolQ
LANGIAEAMYNTALGLGIAVLCMIFHLVLHQRAKNIQHDLDGTQERVFNLLTIQTRPGGGY